MPQKLIFFAFLLCILTSCKKDSLVPIDQIDSTNPTLDQDISGLYLCEYKTTDSIYYKFSGNINAWETEGTDTVYVFLSEIGVYIDWVDEWFELNEANEYELYQIIGALGFDITNLKIKDGVLDYSYQYENEGADFFQFRTKTLRGIKL